MRFQICATVACLLGGLESTTASSLLAQHDSQLGLTESFLGGDELLQLDADSDASESNSWGGKVLGLKSRGEKFALATQEFTTKVAILNKLYGEAKTSVNYKGEAYDYCKEGNTKAFNKKSFEIEEELNEKLENLLSKRNDLAESIEKPKAALFTKEELSKKLNAKGGEATHKQIDAGIKKGLEMFDKRIEADFEEDEKTKVWSLKKQLQGNNKEDGSRAEKIDTMTDAMNLWAGSWKDKEINMMSSPTRYSGTQVFAESLIKRSCAKTGQEERSNADLAKDIAVGVALAPLYIIGYTFKALASMPYWAVLALSD